MKIVQVTYKETVKSKNVFLALFQESLLEKEEVFSLFPREVRTILAAFAKKEFKGEEKEVKSLWLGGKGPERIVLFGLGEKAKWNERAMHLLPRRLIQYAKTNKIKEFAVPFRKDAMRRVATNMEMARFEFNVYKERPKSGWPDVKKVSIAFPGKDFKLIQRKIREELVVGEEVNACRHLANTPGGDMTPVRLAGAAQKIRRHGVRVTTYDEKKMKKLGMDAVLGVARGSDEKPRLIILEYKRGPKTQKPLVLVGKGVTFDTGGLNLKDERSIYEMHMDMSGGAAVIHGVSAIARLKLPVNVVGLIPAVENMPSGSSYRPGDLLKSMSGKTIEVLNTDAEGRVILADALYYGTTKYKPGFMVDFATLTGAAHVALGNYCSAVFAKDEGLHEKLVEIGKRSGDYVWPLPLWDEYLSEIKGTFGDLANVGKGDRWGGAIHGAKFLEQFVGETRWAHIDIAPKMTTLESEHLAKGASGVGVRYIVELAKEYPRLVK